MQYLAFYKKEFRKYQKADYLWLQRHLGNLGRKKYRQGKTFPGETSEREGRVKLVAEICMRKLDSIMHRVQEGWSHAVTGSKEQLA